MTVGWIIEKALERVLGTECLTVVELVFMEILSEATALHTQHMYEDDVVLWLHLNRTDVPWDFAPNIANKHIVLKLGGWWNGAHLRVME